MSPRLSIDGRMVEAKNGQTILEAARSAEIAIPTLCDPDGEGHRASCMVCAVEVKGTGEILAACEALAQEGLEVESRSEAAIRVRNKSLALLLSEHAGDCVSPCARACPARVDCEAAIRLIAEGRVEDSFRAIAAEAPFPAILALLCPAHCEKACLRGGLDRALRISSMHRIQADATPLPLRLEAILPDREIHRQVAIRGGLRAMAAAFHLRRNGYSVILDFFFGEYDPSMEVRSAVETELRILEAGGVTVHGYGRGQSARVNEKMDLELSPSPEEFTYPARALRRGREDAMEFQGLGPGGGQSGLRPRPRHSILKHPTRDELFDLAAGTLSPDPGTPGFEACLRCGCSRKGSCELLSAAEAAGGWEPTPIVPRRKAEREYFKGPRGALVHQSGKCILCGRCVRLSERGVGEDKAALSFYGRSSAMRVIGFDGIVRVLAGIGAAGPREIAMVCPTGALSCEEAPNA